MAMAETDSIARPQNRFRSSVYPGYVGGKIDATSGNFVPGITRGNPNPLPGSLSPQPDPEPAPEPIPAPMTPQTALGSAGSLGGGGGEADTSLSPETINDPNAPGAEPGLTRTGPTSTFDGYLTKAVDWGKEQIADFNPVKAAVEGLGAVAGTVLAGGNPVGGLAGGKIAGGFYDNLTTPSAPTPGNGLPGRGYSSGWDAPGDGSLTDPGPNNPGGWSQGSGNEAGSGFGGGGGEASSGGGDGGGADQGPASGYGESDEGGSDDGGVGGCVIATELLAQGIWTGSDRRRVVEWCVRTQHGRAIGEAARRGYRHWARKAVRMMRRSPRATAFWRWAFQTFSDQVTGRRKSIAGTIVTTVGYSISAVLGIFTRKS